MRSVTSMRLLVQLGTALSAWLGASSVYALEPLDRTSGARSPTCLDGGMCARAAGRSGRSADDDELADDSAEPMLAE